MSADRIAIESIGLVTSVGLSAVESCAAFRTKITNASQTCFLDSGGERIMAHQVSLELPWRGLPKLARMAALAISEALEEVPRSEWDRWPLLLCVAEAERPGRLDGLDGELLAQIQTELGCTFAPGSAIVPSGRVGAVMALAHARTLIFGNGVGRVLVAAADSFLSSRTLHHYDREDRLLKPGNSNGFMPGEGAGAMLVGARKSQPGELVCTGIGTGREKARFGASEPLRSDGLSCAIKAALGEAGREMREIDFRITDNSGEHYYFKDATLAASRTVRQRTHAFDIWHPAECTGEVGAVAGITAIAAAKLGCDKRYAMGPRILAHMSNDSGERAALCLEYQPT